MRSFKIAIQIVKNSFEHLIATQKMINKTLERLITNVEKTNNAVQSLLLNQR